jgi:FkbM family methyltransferase
MGWSSLVHRLNGPQGHVLATTTWGARLEVDARDPCGRKIYFFGIWEPNLTTWIRKRLQPGDTFIDVGANIGYYSALASRLVFPAGRVVAVEAIPRTFDVLVRNLRANCCQNVRAINRAASDREERLTFYVSANVICGTSTIYQDRANQHGHNEQQCTVDAAPLCSMLASEEIARTRIVKIDVEGAEGKAIHGLEPFFGGRRDIEFAVEVQTATFDEVTSFFKHRGFHAYHMPNDYSAEAYICPSVTTKLPKVTTLPSGVKELDLIFSRVDGATLS